MADLKISQLTGASTPLAGTEVLPIVQSGSTVKVSVANLTAGRAVATAGGSFTDNITQSTAAKGVNFTANTPATGMTGQLLNWYEEGNWTPVIRGSGTAGTYELAVAYGKYTRVGNQVTLTCGITLAGAVTGGGTGDLQITGMPFAKAANTSCAGAVFVSGIAFNGYLTVSTLTRASSSILYVVETVSNTAVAQVPVSAVGVNDIIDFTLTYTV